MNGNEYEKVAVPEYLLIEEEKCSVCGIEMTARNTVGRLYRKGTKRYNHKMKCGKCYLEWKRMERRKNGEA